MVELAVFGPAPRAAANRSLFWAAGVPPKPLMGKLAELHLPFEELLTSSEAT